MSSPRVVLVTGASRGIGLSIAKALVSKGHNVVLTARNTSKFEALQAAHPTQVVYLGGDISDLTLPAKLIALAVEKFGKLDGVIVNHGILSPIKKIANAPLDAWKTLYNINVFSGVALAKAAIPAMRASKGMFVWISSGASTQNYISWGAYGSSKAAVNSISAHLDAEEKDITSLSLAPGVVATDMQVMIRANDEMDEMQHKKFIDLHATDKLLKPEWVGAVVAGIIEKQDRQFAGKYMRITDPEFAVYTPKE